jgi:hypothetical protein
MNKNNLKVALAWLAGLALAAIIIFFINRSAPPTTANTTAADSSSLLQMLGSKQTRSDVTVHTPYQQPLNLRHSPDAPAAQRPQPQTA